jgi:hypothetical protein
VGTCQAPSWKWLWSPRVKWLFVDVIGVDIIGSVRRNKLWRLIDIDGIDLWRS